MITWNKYIRMPIEERESVLFDSLKKYFLKDIPDENLIIQQLSPGELPCFTRNHKKVFFIDKKSVTSNNKKGFVRLTILYRGHTPQFVKEKALKIIRENHLKKYTVLILYKDLYLAACVLHRKMRQREI